MQLNEHVCDQMKLRFDYNNMMSEFVGSEGITHQQLEESANLCREAYETVQKNRGKDMMGWADLPYNQAEVVADINATAEKVRKNFKYFGTISNPKLFVYTYKSASTLLECSWNSGYAYYIFFSNGEVQKDEETGNERLDSYYLIGLHPNYNTEVKWSDKKDASEEEMNTFEANFKIDFDTRTVYTKYGK